MSVKKKAKSRSKNNAKQPEKEQPANFAVRDRRFWKESSTTDADSDDKQTKRLPTFVEELEEKIHAKQQELDKLSLALHAQREEHKKAIERVRRDESANVSRVKARTFASLLEVADNFERCLQALDKQATENENKGDLEAARDGIHMIQTQFLKVLEAEGATRLEVTGKPFDPSTSEAIATQETNKPTEDNLVLEEYRSGYTLDDQLIRPARVRVGKYVDEPKDTKKKDVKKVEENHAERSRTA